MKSYIVYFLSIIMAGLFSCSEILEENPTTFLAPNNLNSEQGAVATLKGAYQNFQSNGYYQREFLAQIIMKSEYTRGRGSYLPAGNYDLDTRNIGRVEQTWTELYSAINRANVIIANFPESNLPEEKKQQWIAEAKVLRAFHYFHIVRLWGAAPLWTSPVEGLDQLSKAKSSSSEIYAQIKLDLEDAINAGFLPESYAADDKGRATIYAAKTMLAEVHLTLEEYKEAATLANEVMNSGLSLDPEMGNIFSSEDGATHPGMIWVVPFTNIADLGTIMPAFLHNQQLGYSNAGFRVILGNLDSKTITEWDDNDLRKDLNLYSTDTTTLEGSVLTASEPMLFKKYIAPEAINSRGHGNDYSIYRYADVLTIFAEASAMANGSPTTEAYDALNKVKRRGYGVEINTANPEIDYSGLSLEEFREAVWQERAYEFMMEGKRWYDMLRMGKDKAKKLASEANHTLNDEDFFWPIPRQEIDNNDELSDADQNPGY